MAASSKARITGGCQCGAVRYRLDSEPTETAICHCRMCQKASGNYFQALAEVDRAHFSWVRGTPGAFRSSALVERDYCRDCGTPLSYRPSDYDKIWVTVGSLDHPGRVQPTKQYGIESRVIDFTTLAQVPAVTTVESTKPERLIQLKSLQHPDHD